MLKQNKAFTAKRKRDVTSVPQKLNPWMKRKTAVPPVQTDSNNRTSCLMKSSNWCSREANKTTQ